MGRICEVLTLGVRVSWLQLCGRTAPSPLLFSLFFEEQAMSQVASTVEHNSTACFVSERGGHLAV